MKELGLWLNAKRSVFSTTEDHFDWCGMGLNVDAGTHVTSTYRVHPVGCKKYKARPVTHCQTVSETVRSYVSSIQRDTFWTVAHETPEWRPLLHDQGHAAMLTCLGNVEETLVPVPGSRVESVISSDASLMGWGVILEGRSKQGLWKDHHLSWHINRLEMLAVFLALKNFLADLRGYHVLVHSDNTSVVSYINHQGGLRSRPLCKQACQIILWSQGKLLSL